MKIATYPSPIGYLEVGVEADYLVRIQPVKEAGGKDEKTPLSEKTYQQLMEYFEGKRTTFCLPYRLCGTKFQERVWEALTQIPYGETRSYQEIGIQIGQPTAARGVGRANHNNPLAIVIPCHRVIGKNGSLVGYGGGLEIKAWLLALEKGRMEGRR